jgi:hypothetical protein
MLRDTTIQVVVLACTGGSRRIIGVTRVTIDTLAAAAIYAVFNAWSLRVRDGSACCP